VNKRLTLSQGFIFASLIELVGCGFFLVGYGTGYQYRWLNAVTFVLHYPAFLTMDRIRPLRHMVSDNLNSSIFLILLQWLLWILILKVAFFVAAVCQGKSRGALGFNLGRYHKSAG
jgi:hypothetical protein